jgi:hypothetical protein
VRDEIRAIAALGVMPGDLDADVATVDRWGEAVDAIVRPVTDDEAVVLMNALPRDGDTCFGLAWSLLHACETAPGYSSALVSRSTVTGEWQERLLTRLRNAGR